MLITFEGIDGAGKSTALGGVARWIQVAYGIHPLVTREPGGTALGGSIRAITSSSVSIHPMTALMLFQADRSHHIQTLIKPALSTGKTVLCDRFIDSTVAYQGYGKGTSLDIIKGLNNVTCDGVYPDITILLDLEPAIALQRLRTRQKQDSYDSLPLAFYNRVRDGYRAIAESEPDRFLIIDASKGGYTVLSEIINKLPDKALGIGKPNHPLVKQFSILYGNPSMG